MINKKNKLVTHNGSFHADDIFAYATLSLFLEKTNQEYEIVRTRDEGLIKQGDYVFDIGGIYNAEKNLFDHHQVGGAGKRSFGGIDIEYASFGLVWKKYGVQLCGSEDVASLVERKLVAPIDAGDNGIDLIPQKYEILPYFLQNFFYSMYPTWQEGDLSYDEMFFKCATVAREILSREIIQAKDTVLAEELINNIYNNTEDRRIIVLDKNYQFEYIVQNFPEPLYVIYPRREDGFWGVKAVRNDFNSFVNRKNLPKLWAGLRDEELQNVTGLSDAVFCHRGLFMAVSKTKEGAIKLAKIAVES